MSATILPPTYQNPLPTGMTMEEIDGMGSWVAQKLSYERGGDLDTIVQQLGGRIEYQNLDEWVQTTADEIVVNGSNDFVIYLSSVASPLRDRFTIAHELGHYFLHAEMGDKPIRVRRHGGDQVEKEANRFAAGFLMPKAEFTTEAQKDCRPDRLAAIFRVSTNAAQVRLSSLGI